MNLIYSKDLFLLNRGVKKILKQVSSNDSEVETYSFVEDSMVDIVSAMRSYPVFNEKKVLILTDAFFLTDKKVPLHKTFDVSILLSVLEQGINNQVELIFTLHTDKISKKAKIANLFAKKAKITFLADLSQETIFKFVAETFQRKGLKIEPDAIHYLLDTLPHNMEIINHEVQKLLKINKNLTLNDLEGNLTKYFEEDVFAISNAFMNQDLTRFLNLFQDYKARNHELIPLIALLANNIGILRDALVLKKRGLSQEKIASELKVNPYRLKILMQGNKNNIKELNGKIISLYKMNKNLILGLVDQQIIPEYEFVKILK